MSGLDTGGVCRAAPFGPFGESAVHGLLERAYGLRGRLEALPGYDDTNVAVYACGEEDRAWPSRPPQDVAAADVSGQTPGPVVPSHVLKIAPAGQCGDVLRGQHAAMRYVARRGIPVANVTMTRGGEDLVSIRGEGGQRHWARLLTWLPGMPLGTVRPRSRALLSDLGRFVGTVSKALSGFHHPALERAMEWDLACAPETIGGRISMLGPEERSLVEPFLAPLRDALDRYGPRLRRSTVHNDVNDYNLLVDGPEHRDRRVAGLIDFGDLLVSFTVAELAIAVAYALLDVDDPLRAAFTLVTEYHRVFPLEEAETAVLFPLIAGRLCVSVCMSTDRSAMEPDNEYLTFHRQPALRLLAALRKIQPRLAEAVFRHACGCDPCPRGTRLAAWCRAHADAFLPVVDLSHPRGGSNRDGLGVPASVSEGDGASGLDSFPDPSHAHPDRVRSGHGRHDHVHPDRVQHEAGVLHFDFSTNATEWVFRDPPDLQESTRAVWRALEDRGATTGIGRYGEVRLVYRGEQFRMGSQRRTVHLGVDVFQPPGSPIFAPLDGIVHSVADDDRQRYGYGPVVILEHRPEEDLRFWTLYGHLARTSVESLQPGMVIRAGAKIAEIGDARENGGWVPHVHVQLVSDLLDHEGTFPGVAVPWMRVVWEGFSPDPGDVLGFAVDSLAAPAASVDDLLDRRRRSVSPSLSLAYRSPIVVHRGYGAYLYDRDGQAFLDTVNNVAHVGHSHPVVAEAVARMARVLSTNTRYLYDSLTRYAQRLLDRFPDPLNVCFLVNSGSEANDLALRIARSHVGASDVIVIDHAYHGHLSSLIDVSPYKFAGEGGSGCPSHVHVVPMPDPYRYAGSASDHVATLRRTIEEASGGVCAFIAESAMGCGGQVLFPEGYLREAFEAGRRAGVVCIADEVQTGFGRFGRAFWAFELQGAVPDIVTLGKPIGNGYPMGAVVTTHDLARSFHAGMEYFNTFGGNPVACAAGLAVLDVIDGEDLQSRANVVGDRFLEGLSSLYDVHGIIGDVRGCGLFLGVELVRDRVSKEPAGEVTSYVVERMREQGVLTSSDGPFGNVLKIKPPMVVGEPEVDRYVETLDGILQEDFVRASLRLGKP